MRFMMIVKADKNSEAGVFPSQEFMADMGRYNEELADAGALLAGEGLHPSSKGARIRFSGDRRTVVEGPFPDPEQLIAGYWVIQVDSKEDAIQWASRAPFADGEIEIRQIFEASDFPPEVFPPEEAAREQALRDRLADS